MSLTSGTKLGPYEIVSPLGAGGMGEVYRAKDTRLGRIVAIKILPEQLANTPEAKQRFEREARAVSSLSHSNICGLFDVGSQDGIEYLVMEYLEGETLAQRLEKGPLPIDQVFRIGAAVSDGLDKAHRKGIVHRDLKPSNVMLTKSGPKLLDFGLAKSASEVIATSDTMATMSQTPDRQPSAAPLTVQGTILGTYQYMSPEQAEGQEADPRSDIFSLGAMLYEMATGQRAFAGKSAASVIAAILEREVPAVSSLQPMAPTGFDRVVKKCLAKDPEERWQSAGDLAGELLWLADSGSQRGAPVTVATAPINRKIWSLAGWGLAGLMGLAAVVVLFARTGTMTENQQAMRFSVDAPEGTDLSVSGDGMLAISPDGHYLAFVGSVKGARWLWLRDMYTGENTKVAGTETATFPFWSPDSRFVAFFADDRLKVLTVAGESIRTLAPAKQGRGGSWGKDGTILFSPNIDSGLYQVPAQGGEAISLQLAEGFNDARLPTFLPDGKNFVYVIRGDGLYGATLGKKQPKLVVKGAGSAAFSRGYLFYVREGTLVAQRFDSDKLELSGDVYPVASGMANYYQRAYYTFTISENGPLLFRTGGLSGQLTWFDRNGKAVGVVGPADQFVQPELSPDEKRLVAERGTVNGDQRVWIFDLEHDSLTAFGDPGTFYPAWSPDGTKVALTGVNTRKVATAIFAKGVNGDSKELVFDGEGEYDVDDWSRDGKYILAEHAGGGIGSELWVFPTKGDHTGHPYLKASYYLVHGRFSPDGKWVAYVSNESGQPEVYVESFPAGHGKWEISNHGGDQPMWRRDGKELFYLGLDRTMMAVPIKEGTTIEAGSPVSLFTTSVPYSGLTDYRNNYAVTHDGKKFLINTLNERAGQKPFTAVVNWQALFHR